MAKSKPPLRRTRLSLAMQDMFMRRRFPHFVYSRENGASVWKGTLQPTETSPAYHVVVRYKVGTEPKVRVTKPGLRPDAPHRFNDNSLCLYWYKEWYWTPDQDISQTILPWAALWLYFYELWLDTGEWLGAAAPHSPLGTKGKGGL